jgi:hypothetical protein
MLRYSTILFSCRFFPVCSVYPLWETLLIGRKYRKAVLGKVSVKGERGGNTNPLHHGKARGIGEGKIFVIVLVDNGLGTLHISRRDPHQGCQALFHAPETSGGNILA